MSGGGASLMLALYRDGRQAEATSTPSGPGTFQLAVTGGTGNYQDARGYATVVPGNSPTVTIHLTP